MSTKEERLRAELEKKIGWFEKESKRHKRFYRSLRYVAFGLIACSTILASVALTLRSHQEWFNLAVVIATAAAGVATSIEGLRKPAELWIHERSILYALKDLKREMDYRAAGREPLAIDRYFDRLQSILTESKENWVKMVESSDKGKAS